MHLPFVSRAALVAVALVVVSSPARATDGIPHDDPLSLQWLAPAGCPERDAVVARVHRLLGDARAAEPLTARGVVTERAGRYRLALSTQTGDSHGVRSLNAPSCTDLLEPAALVLALAIDPDAVSRASNAEPPLDDLAPPPASPPTSFALAALRSSIALSLPHARRPPIDAAAASADDVRRDVAAPATPPSSEPGDARVHARAGVGGVIDAGTLPSPAAGVTAALAVGAGWLEVEARGALFAPQTEGVGGGNGAAAGRLRLWSAGLSGCIRVFAVGTGAGRSARVLPCVGADVARLSGRGEGVSSPGEGAVWLGAAVAGVRGTLDFTEAASLWLRVDGAAAPSRPRFVLENVGAVHQPAALSARAALGAEVRFP